MHNNLNTANLRILLLIIGLQCTRTPPLLAHNGMKHEKRTTAATEELEIKEKPKNEAEESLKFINTSYQDRVKPALLKACGDCHSKSTARPWYSKIPGVAAMIESDISEAKLHLDISNDFPFEGHGSPREDLEAIEESLLKGEMPPLKYKLMHPQNRLSEDEENIILHWIKTSLQKLKE